MKRWVTTVSLVCMCAISGCQYYEVTDPASGRKYYTNDWISGRYRMNGAVQFTDIPTGKLVTLQSSEVRSIPKSEVPARDTADFGYDSHP